MICGSRYRRTTAYRLAVINRLTVIIMGGIFKLRRKALVVTIDVSMFLSTSAALAVDYMPANETIYLNDIEDIEWTNIHVNTDPAFGHVYHAWLRTLADPAVAARLHFTKEQGFNTSLDNQGTVNDQQRQECIVDSSVETIGENLIGADYVIVVTTYMVEAAVKTTDRSRQNFKYKLGGKIYGAIGWQQRQPHHLRQDQEARLTIYEASSESSSRQPVC